jgi:hypothetical protein
MSPNDAVDGAPSGASRWEQNVSNKIIVASKNQIVVAFIVVGAIIFAIPICIFGLIRLAWVTAISSAKPRAPEVQEKLRHLLEAVETRIGPQTTDKQSE